MSPGDCQASLAANTRRLVPGRPRVARNLNSRLVNWASKGDANRTYLVPCLNSMPRGKHEPCQCPSFSLLSWRSVHASRGVLHLVSTRQRIGKPALGIGIPERGIDTWAEGGMGQILSRDYPVRDHILPQIKQRAVDKVRWTKQARSLSDPVPSCKTAGLSCVPAGRLDSVASAEWDY